ncbi:MAG TPA: glycosyltransferase family 9 protein [Gemmatimonadaceae bacterium]
MGRPLHRISGLSAGRKPGAAPVRSILVVETWNIGDVVLAIPFLAELRAIFPEASISLLAREHAREILAHTDLVDDVITIDLPYTTGSGGYRPSQYMGAELRAAFKGMREREFDLGFESRMDPRGKLVLALSGAARRVAYDYGGANWLLTDPIPVTDRARHKNEDWMGLLAPFGGPRGVPLPQLTVSAGEAAWARDWLAAHRIDDAATLIAVHPGASSDSKRWPIERFAAVVRALVARRHTCVLAIRSPDGSGGELAQIPGVAWVQPDLRQLLALLARADVLLCNDSGPMHLAAALGTRTVAIFHTHAAREFAPLGEGHRMLQPAGQPAVEVIPPPADALLSIGVPGVLDAINQTLGVHA